MAEFNSYYFPWVRKGLGTYIDEKESLGQDGMILCRPELTVKSKYNVRHNQPEEGQAAEESTVILEKTVKFNGPGDVLRINTSAVMKVHPEAGSEGFPVQYLPYIEFWEPDFLWRYTPAAENDGKLRPWLALVVCRQEDVRLGTIANAPYFTFIGNDEAWAKAFPSVSGLHRCAHAQGGEADKADFCRLLGMRDEESLDSTADYIALLIPAYETGRLRGLGLEEGDIQEIPAQRPSWDVELARQKSRKRGLEFPVYYKWYFKTGTDNFDTIARRLEPVGDELKAGLVLDVTDMGEGFSYNTVAHGKSRTSIVMPAATLTTQYKSEVEFPASGVAKYQTEEKLYKNLNTLLSKNPVFAENRANLQGNDAIDETGDDDPMVVPPVYGARHAMAKELDEKSAPWLKELNMDVHHRAAAGLGRKIVQKHQEELMDRAWKQVEAIQALNQELYERLMSINANKFLQHKTVDKFQDEEDPSKFLGYFMRYLATMKHAAGKDAPSMASIISEAGIPASFAAPSFHHNTEKLARIVEDLDESTLMDNIVKNQLFKFTPEEPVSALSLDEVLPDDAPIETWGLLQKNIHYQNALIYRVYKQYLIGLYSFRVELKEDAYAGPYKSLCFPQQSIKLISGLPSSSYSTTQIPLEPYRGIQQLILSFSAKQGDVPYTAMKEAILNCNPDDFCYFPRLYAVETSVYDKYYPGKLGSKELVETKDGLSYPLNNVSTVTPFDTLLISQDLFDLFLKGSIDTFATSARISSKDKYALTTGKMANSSRPCIGVFPIPCQGGFIKERTYHLNDDKYLYQNIDCIKEGDMANEELGIRYIKDYLYDSLSDVGKFLKADYVFSSFAGRLKYLLKEGKEPLPLQQFEEDVKNSFCRVFPPRSAFHGASFTFNEYLHDLFLYFTSEECDSLKESVYGNFVSDSHIVMYLSCFLYNLLNYPRFFCYIWTKVLDRNTLLPIFCYMDGIGPWMTMILAHMPGATVLANSLSSAFTKIDNFLLNTPAYVMVEKSYWSKTLVGEVDGGLEGAIKKAIKDTLFPEIQAYLEKSREMLVKMYKMQVKRTQESVAPVPVNKESVQRLQESMENKEAHDRMIKVARTYYEQFYSDEKLRTEYLEELLRSKYPILAYPFFPEPTYYYLNMISDKFIIPGLDQIPMDHIAMFTSNPKFTEAFLSGMNTEMGSEMQWREYPTDRRGSYFRKFWDSESTVEAIRKDEFFDVKPLHLWEGTRLGENHLATKGNLLIFAIHSDLFKLYPNTHVFLNKAKPGIGKNQAVFDKGRKDPVMETFVRENILLVGFNISIQEALGSPDDGNYGYMLAFEQDLDDLNFSALAVGLSEKLNSAETANLLKDKATIFGKHISRFVKA